jgi:uncharacterized protein YlxW (UPF0749 family)
MLSFPSCTTAKRIPAQAVYHSSVEEMQESRGMPMSYDLMEVENELRNVVQEQRQLAEQINALQQHIHDDETWLRSNPPAMVSYQEVLKELLVLYAYVGKLHAQAVALDDILLELTVESELWDNPGLLLAS